MFKYAELFPCGNSYIVPLENGKPHLYDSKKEVLEEIKDCKIDYIRQIQAGTRDKADQYDGECHKVLMINDDLFLLDKNDHPCDLIAWK